MASWLKRLVSKLFGSRRRRSPSYIWKRKGITRAARGSIEGVGRFGVDKNVFKVESLSGSATKVYVYLSRVADANGYCFPFIRTIVKRTKLSRSTVGKALIELETAGLVVREKRFSRRGGSSSLFHLRKVAEVYPEIAANLPSDRPSKDSRRV